MQMGYAIVIRLGNQWCNGDDIFGIVVLDGTEVAELTLICIIVDYNIRRLHIYPFSFRLCADKINLACMKLSDLHLIPQAYKMIVDDILYHLLNVSLA